MSLRTINDISFTGKKVLMRVDFNVPLKDGVVGDDTRIVSAFPSILHIVKQGGRIILMSHLGRPKGERNDAFSLKPVYNVLKTLLRAQGVSSKIHMASDVIGEEVETVVSSLENGDIVLLENMRFYAEEEKNDTEFAKSLADLGDVYVNDAFGTAHRAHASTEGIAHFLPSYAGFLIEKEVRFFGSVLESPKKPFVAIIGGAKVSSKIAVLESLLQTATAFVIGGGMAYTFLKAQGFNVGKSLVESECLGVAKQFLQKAAEKKVEVVLPIDHLCATVFDEGAASIAVDTISIPDEYIALDIGKKTIEIIKSVLSDAKTVVWNGPMGVFEFKHFEIGTLSIAQFLAEGNAISIIGGGDSVAAANKFGLADRFSHVSTGGGASLEFLEGKILPGIQILQEE